MIQVSSWKGPKLRTKTGCLTCRSRRKKCDENYPHCERCAASNRECHWPSRSDLVDRRHGSRRSKEGSFPVKLESHDDSTAESETSSVSSDASTISFETVAIAHRHLRRDLESAILKHFTEEYYGLLVNPDSHLDFYNDWLADIQKLMIESKSLQYSVMANAASHIYLADGSAPMQELALTYYSRSIEGLAETLASGKRIQDHNAILMSVMFLYVHGCVGCGTYADIPWHLNAAAQIIKLRLLRDPAYIIKRPFERLAVESVMYQMFLVTTGCWGDDQTLLEYNFDTKFWLDCEDLLTRSTMFPDSDIKCNSPVLGLPIAVFKLILTIKQLYQSPTAPTAKALSYLKDEVAYWEAAVTLGEKHKNGGHSICDDASFLFILIASLLVEQLVGQIEISAHDRTPRPAPEHSWQLQKMLDIVRKRRGDNEWERSFVANWPVYTIGFFVSSEDDINLVREDMHQRWSLNSFTQITRFSKDLEHTWTQRRAGKTA